MTHKPVKYFVFYNKQNIHLTETRTLPNTSQIRQFSNNQPIQPPKRSKSNSNPFLRGRPEKNWFATKKVNTKNTHYAK